MIHSMCGCENTCLHFVLTEETTLFSSLLLRHVCRQTRLLCALVRLDLLGQFRQGLEKVGLQTKIGRCENRRLPQTVLVSLERTRKNRSEQQDLEHFQAIKKPSPFSRPPHCHIAPSECALSLALEWVVWAGGPAPRRRC